MRSLAPELSDVVFPFAVAAEVSTPKAGALRSFDSSGGVAMSTLAVAGIAKAAEVALETAAEGPALKWKLASIEKGVAVPSPIVDESSEQPSKRAKKVKTDGDAGSVTLPTGALMD
eukprot:3246156-Pyramimonas_sp.AAC.1